MRTVVNIAGIQRPTVVKGRNGQDSGATEAHCVRNRIHFIYGSRCRNADVGFGDVLIPIPSDIPV